MNETQTTVTPLKKISLMLSSKNDETRSLLPGENISSGPTSFEFIFGIGAGGLIPFECELNGRGVGFEGEISLKNEPPAEYFGHLVPCTANAPASQGPVEFTYKIVDIADTSPRDVVAAMAANSVCGCGCDCDCC